MNNAKNYEKKNGSQEGKQEMTSLEQEDDDDEGILQDTQGMEKSKR